MKTELEKDKRRYYIWGTGIKASRIQDITSKINLIGYIDNDVSKQGSSAYGKEIFSPDILIRDRNAYLIIANKYYKDIVNQIKVNYPWYSDRIEDHVSERIRLIERYEQSSDKEIREVVKYIRENELQVFNYDFIKNYDVRNEDVFIDAESGLFYVIYNGKKMFFSRQFKEESEVREYYQSVLIEQDKMSPHLYIDDRFDVQEGDVVVDAGVAEGNFSLSIIDKVKKIYIFEPDEDWIEALKHTFKQYQDKVVIINKCLSNYINDNTTTIDAEIDEDVDFIKMDIEGEELYALEGSINHLKNKNIKCSICTYHQEFAYTAISSFLEKSDFSVEHTRGYMWYPSSSDAFRSPVLSVRRHIVGGTNRTLFSVN
ncbi:MAG: FkbM family methyltransferase, partial [Butyrivibrio sp.]